VAYELKKKTYISVPKIKYKTVTYKHKK